jgi:hypothetical protein
MLKLDITFNTNNLGFLLFVAIGITYTGRSFFTAFAFGGAKNDVIFRFFFECFKKLIFIDEISLPRVFVSDQALGLIIIIDNSFLNTIS